LHHPLNRVFAGARPVSWIQGACAEIRQAHPDRQVLMTRKEAPMSPCIAVIDDDPARRELLHDLLGGEAYRESEHVR
jgi:hypothetical protein